MAHKYMTLELKRLINQAEIGIMTPLTIIKPVVSHCTEAVEIEKSFIIAGKAVFIKVLFKIVQKEPTIKTKTKRLRL
ncbi:hypothetical protein FC32_GL001715 [Ligilactobacillus apodemi DSM 16634 = JCM 16172]|uniref:Uncharacterized protein n=1 Tax=Ligilactobacillus apodemi DSM 16634 = JCM 16172 TaxID=1423724 RepID=A0A0R1U1Q1_9LACO|nr:hypothetical protein FC32_GL001715 [Ligilactobacillus apodemi DSM 16634 = JCM 16172]